MNKHFLSLTLCGLTVALASCSNDDPNPEVTDQDHTGEAEETVYNPGAVPTFDYSIKAYDGTLATDIESDQVDSSDTDLYHENTDWTTNITVKYEGDKATVTGIVSSAYKITGAHVDLNIGTRFAKITLTGTSDDGSLRLSGEHRHLLVLDGLTLTSTQGPAINDQDNKRVFLHLADGTVNTLTDAETYAPYPDTEDRKGCFFSEGHVVLSGTGSLVVTGKQRHGFATDGYMYVRPGATLAVLDAVKNAIHVKGSLNNGIGIQVEGGYIYANTSAPAGKAMKTDIDVVINGGALSLNCSGNPAIDITDNTLSSAACIKTDGKVYINSGTVTLTATGNGGKGIKANGDVIIQGGTTTAAISGDSTTGSDDTATPKGIKADMSMKMGGGTVNVSAIGHGAQGIEAGSVIAMTGGVIYTYGTDNGILSEYAISDSRGTILAGGAHNTICSFTHDVTFTSDKLTKGAMLMVVDETAESDDEKVLATFCWPVATSTGTLLFSEPKLDTEKTNYTLVIQ